MSSAKANLASWEKRLLAFALDSTALFIVLAVFVATGEHFHLDPMYVAIAILVVFMAYHSTVLLLPNFSFGRTVAGISVVSVRGIGDITHMQAFLRPFIRIVFFVIFLFISVGFKQNWLIALPFVIEVALIAHTSWRQSVADLLAGTVVVITPQPQPHRAPAVPMYSATDAEFGPPPRQRDH